MGLKNIYASYSKGSYILLRIVLGAVFIWASWSKILEPDKFAGIVQSYQILPQQLVNPVAVLLPWVEAICGLCLLSGYWVKGSVLIVNFLMIVFILALAFNLYRGVDVACGCFAVSAPTEKISIFTVTRDIALLTTGLWILYFRIKKDAISDIAAKA